MVPSEVKKLIYVMTGGKTYIVHFESVSVHKTADADQLKLLISINHRSMKWRYKYTHS
jgi:hypothetical protein